jgi:hypothetical protein
VDIGAVATSVSIIPQGIAANHSLFVPINVGGTRGWEAALANPFAAAISDLQSNLLPLGGSLVRDPLSGHGNILVGGEQDALKLGGSGMSWFSGSFGLDEAAAQIDQGDPSVSPAALDLAFGSMSDY